jgi:16S rRNA (adenine1518-N6/adenine1519-N6)-dimethyltransferase
MAVNPQPGDRLVEIGPARAPSPSRCCAASALTVIEFDRDLIAPLTAAAAPLGELTIVHRDVLRWTSPTGGDGAPMRLVGNLPYNISSPILFHALEHAARSATCTSCCRRKWSTAWPPAPAARSTAGSA